MTHVALCRCKCGRSDGVAGVAEDVEMCKGEDGPTVMATHSRIGASDGVGSLGRLEVGRSGAIRKCSETGFVVFTCGREKRSDASDCRKTAHRWISRGEVWDAACGKREGNV